MRRILRLLWNPYSLGILLGSLEAVRGHAEAGMFLMVAWYALGYLSGIRDELARIRALWEDPGDEGEGEEAGAPRKVPGKERKLWT
jgi:hypothetical protein